MTTKMKIGFVLGAVALSLAAYGGYRLYKHRKRTR